MSELPCVCLSVRLQELFVMTVLYVCLSWLSCMSVCHACPVCLSVMTVLYVCHACPVCLSVMPVLSVRLSWLCYMSAMTVLYVCLQELAQTAYSNTTRACTGSQYHICRAESNYGYVEVEFQDRTIKMGVRTPEEEQEAFHKINFWSSSPRDPSTSTARFPKINRTYISCMLIPVDTGPITHYVMNSTFVPIYTSSKVAFHWYINVLQW